MIPKTTKKKLIIFTLDYHKDDQLFCYNFEKWKFQEFLIELKTNIKWIGRLFYFN